MAWPKSAASRQRWGAGAKSTKKHNGVFALDAKVDLRRRALSAMGGGACTRVFDAFCGPVGEMFSAVWREAALYEGNDLEWRAGDARRRYVGDAETVLRSLDLARYNVFDLDAFGSPWACALIVAARRRWARGERGALVLTDGSDGKTKYGHVRALDEILGVSTSTTLRAPLRERALAAWCRRAGVVPQAAWRATGYSGPRGSIEMAYQAVVFTGS